MVPLLEEDEEKDEATNEVDVQVFDPGGPYNKELLPAQLHLPISLKTLHFGSHASPTKPHPHLAGSPASFSRPSPSTTLNYMPTTGRASVISSSPSDPQPFPYGHGKAKTPSSHGLSRSEAELLVPLQVASSSLDVSFLRQRSSTPILTNLSNNSSSQSPTSFLRRPSLASAYMAASPPSAPLNPSASPWCPTLSALTFITVGNIVIPLLPTPQQSTKSLLPHGSLAAPDPKHLLGDGQ
ncbi:hypothetical protein GOP47_0030232 [Adiantum capillus-veneris]|nr:hypothetical protein GOP47_0030232 [Adiantum capillus-veneris]